MPTFGQLKTRVAAFLNRSPASFVSGGEDLLTAALNGARKWAEMQHNFELAKTSAVFPTVSLTGGALLTSAVDYYTNQSIPIKVIERAFIEDGKGGLVGIGVHSRGADILIQRKGGRVLSVMGTDRELSFSLVRHGERVYLTPPASSFFPSGVSNVKVYCDVVRWLPDYTSVDQTDFMTLYCDRFLLFKAVADLNFYLKEDPRTAVSQQLLVEEWNNVLRWDASLVDQTAEDYNLE